MNNHLKVLVALCAGLVIPATGVFAQDMHTYIGSQAAYINADNRLAKRGGQVDDDSFGLSGYVGFPITSSVGLELQLFANDINTNDGFRRDLYEIGSNFDLVYQWGNRESFTPFVLGGLGVVRNHRGGGNGPGNVNTGYGNLGLGFVFSPSIATNKNGIRIRGETRYAHNTVGEGQNDFQVRLGLEVPLGRTVERTIEIEKIVEKRVPVPVEQMPAKPKPDDDNDGVENMVDACANTMAGTDVDKLGCAVGLKDIRRVTFLSDSAHLTPNAKMLLDQAARALKGQPNIQVQIAGHTDSIGSDSYNQRLSSERALAVRDYLVNQGVSARRITTTGYGEAKPAADNNSAGGRELNRRVDMVIHL